MYELILIFLGHLVSFLFACLAGMFLLHIFHVADRTADLTLLQGTHELILIFLGQCRQLYGSCLGYALILINRLLCILAQIAQGRLPLQLCWRNFQNLLGKEVPK